MGTRGRGSAMTSALRLDPGFDDDPYDGPYDEQGAAPDLDPGLRHVVAAPYEHAEPVRRVRRGRVRRQPVTQTRTHGGVAARSTDVRNVRPMVRATAGVVISAPPPLRVVPTRRRAARLVGLGFAVVFVLMVGAAAFQTQLARRQVELDKIDRHAVEGGINLWKTSSSH